MVYPHGMCPGRATAWFLRSESAYRRNTPVSIHNTSTSIAVWKIKVTQHGIFSFYISLLSFSPHRDRSNKLLNLHTQTSSSAVAQPWRWLLLRGTSTSSSILQPSEESRAGWWWGPIYLCDIRTQQQRVLPEPHLMGLSWEQTDL